MIQLIKLKWPKKGVGRILRLPTLDDYSKEQPPLVGLNYKISMNFFGC